MTRVIPRFAVHPGWVRSQEDGQLHYITAFDLARLYQLEGGEWFPWNDERPQTYVGRRWEDHLHLFPSKEGRYGRPEDP